MRLHITTGMRMKLSGTCFAKRYAQLHAWVLTRSGGRVATRLRTVWLNLEAQPRAIVHVGGQQVSVVAREVLGEERTQLWKELVDLYDGLVAYQEGTTRLLPVVFLAKSGKSPP